MGRDKRGGPHPSDSPRVRLSKTISFLLRHRPDVGDLSPDAHGWVEVEALCGAVSTLLKSEVHASEVHALVSEAQVARFEIRETRIRAVNTRGSGPPPPDILYHATTADKARVYKEQGAIQIPGDRPVLLSTDEAQAWRAAHRQRGDHHPAILYVDAARARRNGLRLQRNRRNGLFMAEQVSVAHVLNLQENYAEQLSAGGIPMLETERGPLLALIRVTRRSGITWEVAKGKLEDGETPEHTAIREVKEEMGLEVGLEITRPVGEIRYGFMAPGGLPRLKTVFIYLMRPTEPLPEDPFTPSEREGIRAVRWFTPSQAARAVRHSSLQPLMRHVRDLLR